jgi:hypothetical protein
VFDRCFVETDDAPMAFFLTLAYCFATFSRPCVSRSAILFFNTPLSRCNPATTFCMAICSSTVMSVCASSRSSFADAKRPGMASAISTPSSRTSSSGASFVFCWSSAKMPRQEKLSMGKIFEMISCQSTAAK